ncbi:MAG: hypothetical protein ACRDP6_06460, partial [Actinoallomurus sp.]
SAPSAPGGNAARLPVTFAPNVGQAAHGIRYVGEAAGVSVAFTDTGVTLGLTRGRGNRSAASSNPAADAPKPATTSVSLRFFHANTHPAITGADRSSAVVNDFHGSDHTRWHTAIPTFGQVVYHDLWPGIDGVFSTKNGTLKYSFTLARGANPDDVRLSYAGASKLAIDRDGQLAITAGETVLHDQAPVSYQNTGGVNHRIATRYRLLGSDAFGFTLARHAAAAPLTIDPGLEYGTYLGGSTDNNTAVYAVDRDEAGDLYVFGESTSTDFPTTQGSYQPTLNRGADAIDYIVAKFDPTGTHLIYSTFVGGSGDDTLSTGAVDGNGAVYVAGMSSSRDFPTSTGAYRRTPYITRFQGVAFKLNPAGSQLVYSTYLAPTLVPNDIAVGSDGSATIGGSVGSDYEPTTPGAFQTTYPGGGQSGYLVRLNPTGSDLLFATYVGVPITDQIKTQPSPASGIGNVAVDSAGATYVTGGGALGFPITPGGFQPTKGGGLSDAALIKLDPSGHKLDYATYIGDPDGLSAFAGVGGLAVDKAGNAYVAGSVTPGAIQPTPDAYQPQCLGTACAAVIEYGPAGSVLYSTYFGGTSGPPAGPTDLAIDGDGRVYLTGIADRGAGLPVTSNAYSTTPGDYDKSFFVSVFGRGTLLYSTYFGGASSSCLGGVCGFSRGTIHMAPDVSSSGVYLGGFTTARDFPVTPGSFQPVYPGDPNAGWAAKLSLPDLPAATAPAAARPPLRGGQQRP